MDPSLQPMAIGLKFFRNFFFLIFLAALPSGCTIFSDVLVGDFEGKPSELTQEAKGKYAEKLIKDAFDGFEGEVIVDHHAHIFGTGSDISGLCPEIREKETDVFLNPNWESIFSPLHVLRKRMVMRATQVEDKDNVDLPYLMRLLELFQHFPNKARMFLFAMDWHRNINGQPVTDKTDLYVGNDYIIKLSDCLNKELAKRGSQNRFEPVVSIHPYRMDAVAEAQRFSAQGIQFIKWLPPVMGFDPSGTFHDQAEWNRKNPGKKNGVQFACWANESDKKIRIRSIGDKNKELKVQEGPVCRKVKRFYETIQKLDMVLLTHTGAESSLRIFHDTQTFGEPDLLELPLDMGVTVVMAHSGVGANPKTGEPYVNSFLEMMDRAETTDTHWKVYGDLSATNSFFNQNSLIQLLDFQKRPYLKCRLVNGSDYPLPAAKVMVPTGRAFSSGLITEEEKKALDFIHEYNPLVFDFVLKRTQKHPQTGDILQIANFLSVNEIRNKCH